MSLRFGAACACLLSLQGPAPATVPPVLQHQEIADFSTCHLVKGRMYTPYVAFTVDAAGRPQGAHLSQTSGNACADVSAVRVIPTFVFGPAKREGKPVSFPMELGVPMMDVGKPGL